MQKKGFSACVAFFGLIGAASAETTRIAVPEMRLSGVEPSLARVLTEIITTEASKLKGVSVVGASDIDAMLGFEQQKQLLGCEDDVSCMAELGGALGVALLLVSDLGKVGKTFVLNLKLVDIAKVAVIRRVYEVVPGEPDALIGAVRSKLPEVLAVITPAEAESATSGLAPDSRKQEEKVAVAITPRVEAQHSERMGTWPMWTLIGVGGGALALAGVLEIAATAEHNAADQSADANGADIYPDETFERGESARSLSRAALITGLGGALLAGGGLLWLLLRPDDPSSPAVAPVAIKGGGGIVVRGGF